MTIKIVSNKIVGLSVAHYPADPGACYQAVCEHSESIIWTNNLENQLNQLGYECITAPIGGLTNKVKYLNRYNISACVEIHFNSAGNTDRVKGCETLFCPGSREGIKFAKTVHDKYAAIMQVTNRGVKQGWYQMDPNKGKDYFLRATKFPALILEPDFISNIDNIRSHMWEAVQGIALGIHFYLEGSE